MPKTPSFRTEMLWFPGASLPDHSLRCLVRDLRAVAATCFDSVPDYQCLEGSREELADKLITVARNRDGRIMGFCSAVVLPVFGIGNVLHLGLTCVHPDARGARLTHRLSSKLTIDYLLHDRPWATHWVSNVACVLSSLGNVALHFDAVYPSPFLGAPSDDHRVIARAIDSLYRGKTYIHEDAVFDEQTFVFRGSVKGTVFQKSATDRRFGHRDPALSRFYASRMRFHEGDEVLQVGTLSLGTIFRYLFGRKRHGAHQALPRPSVVPQSTSW